MATKSNIKVARELLERFFRDAEGRTNRQLDVYFTLQDMELPREKSDPALEFLTSRGLINTFGPDIAYLTDKGAQSIIEDLDIATLPKEIRDFGKPASQQSQAHRQPEPIEMTPASSRPPVPQITHIDPEGREYALPLRRVCTIGRSPGNDIQVNDQRASKRHAEIRWEDGHYVMIDLGSANGTLLNGEYTDRAVLEHDDELVIGRTMLIFQCPEGPIPEPPEKEPEEDEEQVTADVGPEVARAFNRPTERPVVVEPAPSMPPPQAPSMPPSSSMPPPSSSLPPPSVPPPIKVVKGRPEIAHQEPSRPVDDLFAEDPTPKPKNLFQEEARSPSPPGEPSGDLFAPEKQEETGDLFRDEPTPVRQQKQDLFPPPSRSMGDEETVGSGNQLRLEDVAPEMAHDEAQQSADLPVIDPIEVAPNDPLYEPLVPAGTRTLEPMGDERTVAESPVVVPPDYEVSDPNIPAFTNWDGVTNDDVLLENQPVISEVEIPEIPEIRAEEPKKDDDAATLMMSRGDLFAQEAQDRDDLVRWGEERTPAGSHPEFAAPEPAAEGEALPLASHSIINLRAPSSTGQRPAEAARSIAFHETLAAIRERAERADLPDRDELLGAIDLLEHHAYVRVALAMIEREER